MARQVSGCLFRRGKVYWCQYRFKRQVFRFSLKTTNEDYANRELDRRMILVRAAILDGSFEAKYGKRSLKESVIPTDHLRLADAWKEYEKCRTRPQSSDSTLLQYEYQFQAFVTWMHKKQPRVVFMNEVTSKMTAAYLASIETQMSANTFNKHLDTGRRTFRVLKRERDTTIADPWDGYQHKRHRGNHRQAFTIADAKLIVSKAQGWQKTLWLLGFFTGQRLVDCTYLRWDQVDLVNCILELEPRKTRHSSGLRVELPIHAELLQHLRELQQIRGDSKYVVPEAVEEYERNQQTFAVRRLEFLKQCGFQVHQGGTGGENQPRAVPQYGFHSCRHFFVSTCRNAGVPDSVVQSIVGNSYLLYSHVDRGSKQQAVEKLPWLGEQPTAPTGEGTPTEELDSLNYNELLARQQAIKDAIERRVVKESKLKMI